MGWFEKQVKQRQDLDQQMFEESLFKTAEAVLGNRAASKKIDQQIIARQATEDILKFYHFKPVEIPKSVREYDEQLEYSLRPHGIMRRNIQLEKGWYRDSYGPVLAYLKEDGSPVAILPKDLSGYYYIDHTTGAKVNVTAQNEQLFEAEAYCFYRPLPQKKIGIPDLIEYIRNCLCLSDILLLVGVSLAATLVGMMVPRITRALTGPVLQSGNMSALVSVAITLACVAIVHSLINSASGLFNERIQTKTSLSVEAAMMMRMMTLPAPFFRKFSAGELTKRMQSANQLCSLIMGIVFSAGLSSVFSLLYVRQIFSFAPALVQPSLLFILLSVAVSIGSSLLQVKISRRQMELDAKQSGISYSMITGVQKIKLAGAEKRVFSKWMNLYAESAKLTYNPPMFLKINGVINLAISLLSTIVLYRAAADSGVNAPSYLAFNAAYGSLMGAFMSLAGLALKAATIKPILEMAEPLLNEEPEVSDDREIVTSIAGGIEMNNVYFRYSENMPYIVNDMSLKINPGEYIAIVGRTGCGKSTLMRLLLGFEKPERGAIYYDHKDMKTLDLCSLRRKIGVVTQNSGLFQGDLCSNILISAPDLTVKDAWEAAEKAGLADDIRAMPMGLQTMVSEGGGGFSGGQRQRIMIARAIAPKPKLLMFDEATSALDNKTQKQVSEALDQMGCTRIVIAHRLSTIRNCDRILFLEGGKIAEDGTYDELIAKGGLFADLVERQRLDTKGA